MPSPNCSSRRLEEVVASTLASLKEDAERTLEALTIVGTRRDAFGGSQRSVFGFTPSERNVLRLIGLGLTNEQIGKALFLSPQTVRVHAKRIHDKCGIEGRARLAVTAYRLLEAEGAAK